LRIRAFSGGPAVLIGDWYTDVLDECLLEILFVMNIEKALKYANSIFYMLLFFFVFIYDYNAQIKDIAILSSTYFTNPRSGYSLFSKVMVRMAYFIFNISVIPGDRNSPKRKITT
jgi:hypothetical protein